jgi:ATP-dependent protease HslVU (ClpYQ) peptidase subunit
MPPTATLDLDATLVIVDLDATLVIANSHQVIARGYRAFRRHQIMLPSGGSALTSASAGTSSWRRSARTIAEDDR